MAQELASGTVSIFRQSVAPINWTKITAYNDYTIRIVTGTPSTGGSFGFINQVFTSSNTSSVFSSQTGTFIITSVSLAPSGIPTPYHEHSLSTRSNPGSYEPGVWASAASGYTVGTSGYSTKTSGSAGSGVGHTHPFIPNYGSPSQIPQGSFVMSTSSFAIQYVDVIMAQRN
jgi:hypothetical protein